MGKTDAPRKAKAGRAKRYVSNEARRQAVARDGMQCSFVSEDGRRCEEIGFLELDHVVPVALGGDAKDGVRILCRLHNQYEAERILGRETVEAGKAARASRPCRPTGSPCTSPSAAPRGTSSCERRRSFATRCRRESSRRCSIACSTCSSTRSRNEGSARRSGPAQPGRAAGSGTSRMMRGGSGGAGRSSLLVRLGGRQAVRGDRLPRARPRGPRGPGRRCERRHQGRRDAVEASKAKATRCGEPVPLLPDTVRRGSSRARSTGRRRSGCQGRRRGGRPAATGRARARHAWPSAGPA